MTRVLSALAGLILSALALAAPARAEMRLIMFEQACCAYCIMW
ncbi:thioredoxin family protein, partial [Escherichia coli]|nr:thioredoxin family protein [Escherichia coli]